MSVTLTLRRTKSGTRARRTCDDSERPGHVTTGLNHGGHMARPRVPLTGCSVRLIQPYDDAIEKTVSDFYEEFLRFTTVVGRTRGTYTDNREFYDKWQPKLATLTARAMTANPSGRCPST